MASRYCPVCEETLDSSEFTIGNKICDDCVIDEIQYERDEAFEFGGVIDAIFEIDGQKFAVTMKDHVNTSSVTVRSQMDAYRVALS